VKPGKHQRSKQRCQDLCWKVHDRTKSFVFRSYTMRELRNQHVAIGWFSVRSKQQLCLCAWSRPKKRTKTYNKEICRVSEPFPSINYGNCEEI